MKWLKMRTNWAHGADSWEYIPLDDSAAKNKEFIEDSYILDESNKYSYSDKFRGVEWDIIDTKKVPNSIILKAFEDSKKRIDYLNLSLELEKTKVEVLSILIDKGRKTDPDEVERKRREKRWEDKLKRKKK